MKISPKDFFLHIGAMVTLYVSAGSLLALVFQIINKLHPDALNYYSDPYSGAMRFAIASLIIVFPLFIWLTRLINNDLEANPEKRELGLRKWLTFLTLFVAAVVMAGDAIVVINQFLGGEITTRFILKALAVLVVAKAIFWYYIKSLRGTMSRSQSKMFGWLVALVVLITLIGGFMVMGSPMTQRLMRFDEQKISDLQSIQWQITNYWQAKGALPNTLDDINDPISSFMTPIDPQTNQPYEYKRTGTMSFEICANFNLESGNGSGESVVKYPIMGTNENWKHEAGRACFERVIDPQLYPVNKTV